MKDASKYTTSHPLDNNYQDGLAAVTRAGFDLVPFFGSSITELICSQLKNQWQDRATQFMKNLEAKLESVPIEQINELIQNQSILSLIEKGAFVSARSVSQQKRDYISNLVSNAITKDDLKTEVIHCLLDVFSELNDSEIIWLIYIGKMNYSPNGVPRLSHDSSFYELHKEILSPHRNNNTTDGGIPKDEIQNWYKMRLVTLGLIRRFKPIPNQYFITNLGENLLSMIGINSNGYKMNLNNEF